MFKLILVFALFFVCLPMTALAQHTHYHGGYHVHHYGGGYVAPRPIYTPRPVYSSGFYFGIGPVAPVYQPYPYGYSPYTYGYPY